MDKNFNPSGWSSIAVHGGQEEDSNHAHQTPIYASSTFVFDTAEQGMRRFSGEEKGFIYSRWGNPTTEAAEQKIAELESFGTGLQLKGILHSSGMAAISTLLLSVLKPGEKLLTHFGLYGGTNELMNRVLTDMQIGSVIADIRDLQVAEDHLKKNKDIRLIYLETPANPTIQCVDIQALCSLAKKYDCKVAVDNTFATPYLQQPFALGADYVMHSTTKFLNGHGTAIGGILLGKDDTYFKERIIKFHRLLGGNSNAFDAFLLIQGIKTLELRMDRHCQNAMEVAHFLQAHPAISKVNYAGLPSHPDHKVAMKQMRHPGPMLSFELKQGLEAGVLFMNKLMMCVRTVSLGTVDTLLSHPASMTHYGVPREEREKYGITDGLIRMNVGIENLGDIIKDLDQALS
jgi:methionine-gamma-lyase